MRVRFIARHLRKYQDDPERAKYWYSQCNTSLSELMQLGREYLKRYQQAKTLTHAGVEKLIGARISAWNNREAQWENLDMARRQFHKNSAIAQRKRKR